jgi:hypothetical protein
MRTFCQTGIGVDRLALVAGTALPHVRFARSDHFVTVY